MIPAIASQVIRIKALDQTKKAFRSVSAGLGSVTSKVFSLQTALVALAGVAGFGYLIKSNMNAIDSLSKTAQKIGTTTDALSKLQYAGQLTGVEVNTMNMALQRFVRRTAEASQGTGEAVGALKELGINASALQDLPLDERMAVLADAFNNVSSESDQLRLAFKLFDSEGASLVNTLRNGSGALKDMYADAGALGLVMQNDASKGVERANDELFKLFSLGKGVTAQFASALAPAIGAVSEYFRELFVEIGNSKGGFEGFAKTLAVDFISGLQTALKGLDTFLTGVITTYEDLGRARRKLFGESNEQDAIYEQNQALDEQVSILGKLKGAYEESYGGNSTNLGQLIGQLLEINPKLAEQIGLVRRQGGSLSDVNSFIDEQIGLLSAQKTEVDSGVGALGGLIEILGRVKEAIITEPLIKDVYDPKVPAQLDYIDVSLGKLKNSFITLQDVTDSFTQQAMNSFTQALTDGVTGAKKFGDAIKDMAKGVVDSLIKMLVQYYITQPLFNALTGYFGGVGVSGGGSAPVATGTNSYGGTVSAGQPTIVGERGKELFIPNSNGAIVNSDKLGGGDSVTVVQNINISTGVAQTVRAEISNLMPQIANQAKSAVADARMRGGSYSKALTGA